MLSLTTATTGCDVLSANPKPGYTINLIRTKARTILASQLQMLSSSHIKYQTFFHAPFQFFISRFLSKKNKKVCFLTYGMKLSRPNYYQGILQLRDVNEEMIGFVQKQIAKRGDVAITKTARLPNGVDLYITSQKFIRIVGKKLRDNFGGELKISSRLYSVDRQTSKELHRVTVLYRCCSIKKGSIVELRGEKIKIMSLGHRIQGKRLADGKKVYVDFKELAYSK